MPSTSAYTEAYVDDGTGNMVLVSVDLGWYYHDGEARPRGAHEAYAPAWGNLGADHFADHCLIPTDRNDVKCTTFGPWKDASDCYLVDAETEIIASGLGVQESGMYHSC